MIPNLNVALKGYPKKSWGLFGQKAHKTHQMILLNPKRGGLSLTLTDQAQIYYPKCNSKPLSNKSLGINWDGTTQSTHQTANFCDWSDSNQEQISLVETFLSISQPRSAHSQQDIIH